MADKYKSLKVKELQEILQKNGLPHTGKKEDLIDRLVKHDEKKALELSSLDDLAGLDEFEESKLEDLDALSDLKSLPDPKPATEEIVKQVEEKETTEEPTTTATTQASTETPAPVSSEQKDEKPAEVIKPGSNFKFTPITFDAPKKKATAATSTTKTPGKTPADMTDLEKKIERAKRFKVDLDEKTKQQLRAQRFGTASGAKQQQGQPKKGTVGVDAETLKRRAERFGIVTEELENEKKKKRAERFGIVTKESEDAKRKARAERFGTNNSRRGRR